MISRIKKAAAWLFLTLMILCVATGCTPEEIAAVSEVAEQVMQEESLSEMTQEASEQEALEQEEETQAELDEQGSYSTKDEVALYLHTYGRLPENYITKKEAEELGWDSKKGNLTEVAPDKSIGGSHFGNYEGQLPEKEGRKYYECDLNYEGGYRGAERIIYSNDGLIFYTGDHYKTFEQLY